MTSPQRGKRDYFTRFYRKLVSEPYRAIGREGNRYSVEALIGERGDARQQELMVQIRPGLITSYDDVWTLYPRNVKIHYRSIMYHLELAAEQRIRLANIQRSIGFRRLSILWPGEEGLRLSVLQRLTQFGILNCRGIHTKKIFLVSSFGQDHLTLGSQHYLPLLRKLHTLIGIVLQIMDGKMSLATRATDI